MREIFQKSKIYQDVLLSEYSTFGIGGRAKLLVMVANISELIEGIRYLNRKRIKYYILGKGSNTLFSSRGFNGVVICLREFCICQCQGEFIYAQAGVDSSLLFRTCYENGLSGLEFISGIPGTVGGMAKMNAGAYGSEVGEYIEKMWILRGKKVREIAREKLKFIYRDCKTLMKNDVVLACQYKLKSCKQETIAMRARELNIKRHRSQPIGQKSCGSMFKRCSEQSAAYYIDRSGLKGYQIGGAKVSEKHAGFIINFSQANSQDVLNLVDYIKKVVYNKYKVKLKSEIKFIEF